MEIMMIMEHMAITTINILAIIKDKRVIIRETITISLNSRGPIIIGSSTINMTIEKETTFHNSHINPITTDQDPGIGNSHMMALLHKEKNFPLKNLI